MCSLLAALLAASIDGEAALRHASALAALGPHPWGSPRSHPAAEYVAAQLREEYELSPADVAPDPAVLNTTNDPAGGAKPAPVLVISRVWFAL